MASLVKTITVCFQNDSPNISSNMLFMPVRLPSKRRLLILTEQHVLQTVFMSMSAGCQFIAEDFMESLVKTITVCFQNDSPNISSNMFFMPVGFH